MSGELEGVVKIGEVLAGKYRVDRVLGVGGMGVVVAATHLQLDQIVALKFILREALTNPEVVSRFEREARAAVRLKSEHVARIIDVGRLEAGSPYIVMEYLEGQDLSALLRQHGSFPVSVACDHVIEACDAIVEAHALGIVHRDLKPANLFLASTSHGRQTIKVLDFGISKSQAPGGDPNMTRTQAVMGSPGYMSPEQMRSSKNVDGRTDVWSLGVILYELVAGRMPFQADTFTALCVKIAMDPHPALPALPAALPAGFEAVVNRALAKDPAQRYASAIELARALAPFASPAARERAQRLGTSGAGVQASGSYQVMVAAAAETTLGASAGQVPATTQQLGRRRRILMFGGIGLGAALAIGVVLGTVRSGGQTSATQPTQAQVVETAPPLTTPAPGAQAEVRRAPSPPPPAVVSDAGVDAAAAPNQALPGDAPKEAPQETPKDHGKSKDRVKTTTSPVNPYDSPY